MDVNCYCTGHKIVVKRNNFFYNSTHLDRLKIQELQKFAGENSTVNFHPGFHPKEKSIS
jgi:hypothetical protein